ncbi:hypothetical protein BSNK01_23690 [Bacillaceae bacterium]
MPFWRKTTAIIAGSLILSVGINFFLVPFKILDGGIIGIALIVNYLWGVKTGLTIILCSIPIYVLAWFRYRRFFYNSLHGMFISSFFIDLVYPYHELFLRYVQLPPLASSLAGGLLVGTGIGLMLRYETSTGGTDLLAQFLAKLFALNVGFVIFLIDAVVIALGGLLISAETFFLSTAAIVAVGLATGWCAKAKPPP